MVKPKKHLGQHFLIDTAISQRIADALTGHDSWQKLLEIGPGTGALTDILINTTSGPFEVVEVDTESIAYLTQKYPKLTIHQESFLTLNFQQLGSEPMAIIGNFPYNISSQILFKVLDERQQVREVVGMFQKEVAERIAEPPGSKRYGVLSVLLQAYYDIEYLFTVHEDVFYPPPKVKSGVLRLTRNTTEELPCDEKLFKNLVKTAFNQRRKTLRNSIKPLLKGQTIEHEMMTLRPEKLGVDDYVWLTQQIEQYTAH